MKVACKYVEVLLAFAGYQQHSLGAHINFYKHGVIIFNMSELLMNSFYYTMYLILFM